MLFRQPFWFFSLKYVFLFPLQITVMLLANKTYDEKEMIDAIENEMKRLDKLKLEAKKGATRRGDWPA